jgi:hypothetical protein
MIPITRLRPSSTVAAYTFRYMFAMSDPSNSDVALVRVTKGGYRAGQEPSPGVSRPALNPTAEAVAVWMPGLPACCRLKHKKRNANGGQKTK